jgi:cytochrome c-type biogenesis protein CcmH
MSSRLALTMLSVAIACSQRVAPEEEVAARERERARIATDDAGALSASSGGVSDTAARSTDPAAVAVTVEWRASDDEPVASTDVLFLFVRPRGVTSGPPLAVRRVPAPSFPLSIEIGPRDAMIPGREFPDSLAVSARLDRDGDATTVGPDDWEATAEPVSPGGTAELVLSPTAAP